ncbi:hypothetical protein CDAR_69711 [Caerostris darwini]|uniref:Uncharacterized protein n=1 Tax=Caerostris darwini TaxID=1538125 RepID=A0AAV4U0Q9_9ARAC|nr:hypothetical protein CDAR_69711 [Caerostris darwini]
MRHKYLWEYIEGPRIRSYQFSMFFLHTNYKYGIITLGNVVGKEKVPTAHISEFIPNSGGVTKTYGSIVNHQGSVHLYPVNFSSIQVSNME